VISSLTQDLLVPEQNTMDDSSWWYGSVSTPNPDMSRAASISGKAHTALLLQSIQTGISLCRQML